MKALHGGLIALLSVAIFSTGAVHSASTTDYSDQWWDPGESGWGAAVLQQSSTLFVDLMAYGTDGKPTWFVAAAALQSGSAQGHTVFLGDLYATTGPYFGGPFNPALVGERKVGTLAFDAAAGNSATVTYSVDGVPVVKNVVRQFWSYEDLSGEYDAIWRDGCLTGDWHGAPLDGFSSTVIRHDADNTVTMTVTYPFYWSDDQTDLRGTYSQAGHLGRIAADLVAPNAGSVEIFEIAKTATGFTARFIETSGNCQVAGRVVAVPSAP